MESYFSVHLLEAAVVVSAGMTNVIPPMGIGQLIAGLVSTGLVAKDYYDFTDSSSTSENDKINAVAPILISLLTTVIGLLGILTIYCSGDFMKVMLNIGTALSAMASGVLVWKYALLVHKCRVRSLVLGLTHRFCDYDDAQRNIHIAVLVFQIISCTLSLVVLILSTHYIVNKMSRLNPSPAPPTVK